ncbi:HAD-IB family hydrolase [Nocardiopsis chromatogenes]|uniref:HAD-IB family hydrolase n=1 Tax=Nocardiopsis chromatogenes TaxID=280239 RepID=UPI000345705F|nr:HAD-IB family hydrolase [Nocardiopsis chromatogenes]
MTTQRTAFAFYDVDETLISIKSMFDYYDFFLEAVGHPPEEQERLRAEARGLIRPGLPRKEGNRLFYRRFAGYKVEQVAEIGRDWFRGHMERGGLFHGDVLATLREHVAAGRTAVLLSGSFSACLDPIAEHAGAGTAIGTLLEAEDGVYTGGVLRSMIGDGKENAARRLMEEAGADPAECHAYGDHTSDAGLLGLVGHPVAVGADPKMAELAEGNGWGRLAGVPE